VGYNQVNGMPLKAADLAEAIGNLVAAAEGIDVDLTGVGTDRVETMSGGDER
jgi:2-oxoglutarate/2-oxoacid ferredoxin oxidoreductase subunit alpha